MSDQPAHTSPLLTETEAIRWLRIDEAGIKDPAASLKRLRDQGRLRAVKISRHVRYPVWELIRFVRREIEGGCA